MKRTLIVTGIALLLLLGLWLFAGGNSKHSKANEQANQADVFDALNEREDEKTILAKPRATITGTIRNEDGAVISGAQVCATGGSHMLGDEHFFAPTCTISGSDGTYTLNGLLPAGYGVHASAPEHRPGQYFDRKTRKYSVKVKPGETKESIDIVLRSGGVLITGTIKDITGGVIAGAQVEIKSTVGWGSGHTFAVADDDGKFSAWCDRGQIDLEGKAIGYSPAAIIAVAPDDSVELFLSPASSLRGKVVSKSEGTPISGAEVSVTYYVTRRSGSTIRRSNYTATTFSDSNGYFTFSQLTPGRYKPKAEAPGFYGELYTSVLVGFAESKDDVVIEVDEFSQAEGVVVSTDGTPCESGWLSYENKKLGQSFSATIRDGSFHLQAVEKGTYEVDISCAKHLDKEDYPEAVVTGNQEPFKYVVTKGQSVVGTVNDEDGNPVSGAWVSGSPSSHGEGKQNQWLYDSTMPDGSFELDGIYPGDYLLRVVGEGFVTLEKQTVTVESGVDTTKNFVMNSGGQITGVVVDEDGNPVVGVAVEAHGVEKSLASVRSLTDSVGKFALHGLEFGLFRVRAREGWQSLRAPGTTDDDKQGQKVLVNADSSPVVKILVERKSGQINGTVVDHKGQPVPDAFVAAHRESERAGAADGGAKRDAEWGNGKQPELTDLDGKFELKDLAPGKYTVVAFRKGGGEAFAEEVEVGRSVQLQIFETGSISGEVVVNAGKIPKKFRVLLRDISSGVNRNEGFQYTNGQWSFTDVPSGKFIVSIISTSGDGFEEVTLAEGENKKGIVLSLVAKATVTGSAVDFHTGEPVKGMQGGVSMIKGEGWGGWNSKSGKNITKADGKFVLDNVPAGRVNVYVFPNGWDNREYSMGAVVAVLKPGETNEVPPIRVIRKRLKGSERAGDIGFSLAESPPGTDPEEEKNVVSLVRASGPAADSGLSVGDEIVSVDGENVTGTNNNYFWSLVAGTEGTIVKFGLARGETISIVLGPPQ